MNVTENPRTVLVRSVQYPPHILEIFHSLNSLRSVPPCDTESRPHVLYRYYHIPPLTPHLYIIIASIRLLIIDESPCWNVNSTQLAAGQRFLSFLDHRYL